MKFNEVDGDLIKLAIQGEFDVIAHGCNCFCTMGRGLAPQMAEAFGCNRFPMEAHWRKGEYNKLGQIDAQIIYPNDLPTLKSELWVINAYTQYHWDTATKPLDYEALTLCLRKINKLFPNRYIGLPEIGCHLAGGDWNIVKEIIKKELKDCDVTIVHYKQNI
jgi:O-acetyl-ADP-ribose deacetylase (regulator of RNase III)